MPGFPYKDAPRLIAKARGGTVNYSLPHPRGSSPLDRYWTLWRVLEYLSQDYPDNSKDLLESVIQEESKASQITTNERLIELGRAFQRVLRLTGGRLDAYTDPDAPYAERQGAKHAMETAVRTLADQRPRDPTVRDAPKAAARLLKALRNAAVHRGAMSEGPTEASFPAGSELLDVLVCRLYLKAANCGPAELKKAIDYYTSKLAGQAPTWEA